MEQNINRSPLTSTPAGNLNAGQPAYVPEAGRIRQLKEQKIEAVGSTLFKKPEDMIGEEILAKKEELSKLLHGSQDKGARIKIVTVKNEIKELDEKLRTYSQN